jgi:hypothetical protein
VVHKLEMIKKISLHTLRTKIYLNAVFFVLIQYSHYQESEYQTIPIWAWKYKTLSNLLLAGCGMNAIIAISGVIRITRNVGLYCYSKYNARIFLTPKKLPTAVSTASPGIA